MREKETRKIQRKRQWEEKNRKKKGSKRKQKNIFTYIDRERHKEKDIEAHKQ